MIFSNIIRLAFSAVFFAQICLGTGNCWLEIEPQAENNIYEMNIEGEMLLTAAGYQNDENGNAIKIETEKVWWRFDRDMLEKIDSGKDSIKLKAKKEGAAEVRAIGIIRNSPYQKTVTILIKR